MADNVSPPPGRILAEKFRPGDIGTEKLRREEILVKGWRWSYLDAAPLPTQQQQQKGVVILIHGFPDQSFAWRYQFPLLTSLGFRTLALDCMGYGHTGSSPDLRAYTFKAHADVIAALAGKLGVKQVILGGHDWGGATVWRVAQWYPSLVSHVFSVCTAYAPVVERFVSTEELVGTTLPQFGYQLQFGSPDFQIESAVPKTSKKAMQNFLHGMYGGKPSTSGTRFMTPQRGIDLTLLSNKTTTTTFTPTPLLNSEEFDFYTLQFLKTGLRGPCNWYRTRKLNWEDDQLLPAATKKRIAQPCLYILATRDEILTREMSRGMERVVPNLTRGEVPGSHWALWHCPDEVNEVLKGWFEGVVLGGKVKL